MKIYDIETNLTLSKEFVLRRNEEKCFLFHIPSSIRYHITKELYAILDFFKYNLISISNFTDILNSQGIFVDAMMLSAKLHSINIPNIIVSEKWSLFREGIPLNKIKGCKSCEFISKCTLKQCRLKPLADGFGFYSHVNYCYKANRRLK